MIAKINIGPTIPIKSDTRGGSLQRAIDERRADVVQKLLKESDLAKRPLPNGEMPFHYAVRQGNLQLVQAMLKANADPYVKDAQGLTAIDHAMIASHRTIVGYLLGHQIGTIFHSALYDEMPLEQRGAIQNLLSSIEHLRSEAIVHKIPELHAAARRGDLESVKLLLNPQDLSPYDSFGMTPLHHAILSGKKEVAQWIIEQGGPKIVEIQTFHHKSLLHLASIGGHPDLIRWLKETYSQDLNALDWKGKNPLHYAMALEDLSTAKALIQMGGDPLKVSTTEAACAWVYSDPCAARRYSGTGRKTGPARSRLSRMFFVFHDCSSHA